MDKTRKEELYESCRVLGVDESRIIVHSHGLLPDCMKTRWPVDLVSQMILQQVETYDIDTVITFDKHGISRHQNHCSIYYGITHLMLEKKLPKGASRFSVLRKFITVAPISYQLSYNLLYDKLHR